MIICKFCGTTTNQIKAGHSKHGKQRYKCKNCLRTYTPSLNVADFPQFFNIYSVSQEQKRHFLPLASTQFFSLEICAGGGGQALGLENAGFSHKALVEIDKNACETLKLNRPLWNVIQADLKDFDASPFYGVDLLSGGVPCPPFSVAGKRLGTEDERNLFDDAIRLVGECQPKAVLLENVRGFLDNDFAEYRSKITQTVESHGYKVFWKLLNAADYNVPQSRQRTIFIALKKKYAQYFAWPDVLPFQQQTVGDVLCQEMKSCGWTQVDEWKAKANGIAPTLVGGSKKHGGADLGPTRAKQAWAKLGVDGHGVADFPPAKDFEGLPKLTVKMAALIQGFPTDWEFFGKKTPAYRQVGNAFPPPIAEALGKAIISALVCAESVELDHSRNDKLCLEDMDQKPSYVLIS